MKSKLIQFIIVLVVAALAYGAIFYYQDAIGKKLSPLAQQTAKVVKNKLGLSPACAKPLTYRLGDIDPRFKLSYDEIIQSLSSAAQIWSTAKGQTLFAYDPKATLPVNFIYDYRQETIDQLKALGINVDISKKSYDELKIKYEAIQAQYQKQKIELNRLIAAYKSAEKSYNAEVAKWNARGGAPTETYNRLQQTGVTLDRQIKTINTKTTELNKTVGDLNAMVSQLNKLVKDLNLKVDEYNTVGDATGKEFQQAVYEQDDDGRRINVYEFSSHDELVRLLAHELGHALGLNHTSSSEDIMYYLNENGNSRPTINDLNELQQICGGQTP